MLANHRWMCVRVCASCRVVCVRARGCVHRHGQTYNTIMLMANVGGSTRQVIQFNQSANESVGLTRHLRHSHNEFTCLGLDAQRVGITSPEWDRERATLSITARARVRRHRLPHRRPWRHRPHPSRSTSRPRREHPLPCPMPRESHTDAHTP